MPPEIVALRANLDITGAQLQAWCCEPEEAGGHFNATPMTIMATADDGSILVYNPEEAEETQAVWLSADGVFLHPGV